MKLFCYLIVLFLLTSCEEKQQFENLDFLVQRELLDKPFRISELGIHGYLPIGFTLIPQDTVKQPVAPGGVYGRLYILARDSLTAMIAIEDLDQLENEQLQNYIDKPETFQTEFEIETTTFSHKGFVMVQHSLSSASNVGFIWLVMEGGKNRFRIFFLCPSSAFGPAYGEKIESFLGSLRN